MKLPTLLAAVVIVSGCTAASETTITVQDPGLMAAGEQLCAANCAECHGADLRGTDKGPSHLSEVYEPDHHADGAFLFAVQNGPEQLRSSGNFRPSHHGGTVDSVSDGDHNNMRSRLRACVIGFPTC